MHLIKKLFTFVCLSTLLAPNLVSAQTDFNPHFIISDAELQDCSWTRTDVQQFLDTRGSYLRNYSATDSTGTTKTAADIIYDSAKAYQINPKFLLVTLQKEQSLITDDSPTAKQLDWATGYAVCDSCSMNDLRIQTKKGFANQVENAAAIMRWYYDNRDKSYIKKQGAIAVIDNTEVVPQSWATAFLYTYTPHLNGNKNFWRIWETWFGQVYPNGSLLKSASSSEMWLLQDGKKRKFASQTALITRLDPKMAMLVPETELSNYPTGADISFPNYSILKSPNGTYLLDYDVLRPFASEEVVRKMGYNPDEVIEVSAADLASYTIGTTITNTTVAPQGIIYQITDLNNNYYLLKDGTLFPVTDKRVVEINFKNLKIEKHKLAELKQYPVADMPISLQDGVLIKSTGSKNVYVIDKGLKRKITDEETFIALGYKNNNIINVPATTAMRIPEGEPLFLNASLLSAKNKFLGDSTAPAEDLFKTTVPTYLVAEYPSGRILAGKNIDTVRPIASLTKLITAYEALSNNFDQNKITTYTKSKHEAYGNLLNLVEGEKIKNKDLLNTMLVASVNNTARMVASATSLTEKEFIKSANDRLAEWGADNTAITDVTGLDAGNKSTGRDMLKIFTKVLSNATLKDILSKTEYSFTEVLSKNKVANHNLKSSNQLIITTGRNYRILASKTGYTEEAGAILLMLVENKKDKKQYVVLTMGNADYNNRFKEPGKLAEWAITDKVTIAKTE